MSIRELQDLDMLQAVEVSPQRLVEIINVRAPDESNFADLELSLLIVSWKVAAFRTCSQVKVAEWVKIQEAFAADTLHLAQGTFLILLICESSAVSDTISISKLFVEELIVSSTVSSLVATL